MAEIAPFKAIRPIRDKVHLVATRPYYSYKKNMLQAKLQDNPYTFLHIINPEFNNPIKTKANSDERFNLVSERYQDFIDRGILIQDEKPHLYLYRQTKGNKSCTGIIGGASVNEYLNGDIKKHEATLTSREEIFTNYLDIVGYNAEPVLISYKGNDKINDIIRGLSEGRPEYEFSTTDLIKHELWVLKDPDSIAIQKHFKEINCTYIADGHHRSASSARLHENNKNTYPNSAHFLSYFVEEEQLQIVEFNRLIKSLNGISKNKFIEQLKEIGSVQSLKEASKPHQVNRIHFYFEEDWYALSIKSELIDDKDPVKKLDSSILTELILNPILGIKDLKTSDQVDFLPGIFSVDEFQQYGIKNNYPLGFVLYPASIDQIKLVADCGLNMPPKSTWVEPKLRSGLTIYNIKE
jgi:uncharacterized protein (DUF1015 family)